MKKAVPLILLGVTYAINAGEHRHMAGVVLPLTMNCPSELYLKFLDTTYLIEKKY